MRLDRLLSIVMILVNRKMVQARELAGMFDVSVRTIYRDIEAINTAGIPIVTYQGINGGVGIMDSYRLDKNVLSQDDILSILGALNGMKSTFGDPRVYGTIEKIKGLIPEHKAVEYREKSSHFIIDLTPWDGQFAYKDVMDIIKNCIEKCSVLSFEYSDYSGVLTKREVEPLCLVLKFQSWYIYAFCRMRNDFRTFKLARIRDLKETGETFIRRDITLEGLQWLGSEMDNNLGEVLLRFVPDFRILAEERFGAKNITIDGKGYALAKVYYTDENWLYSTILGCGENVEVLEPKDIRDTVKEKIKMMQNIYFG